MRPTSAQADRIAEIFADQGRKLTAPDLINAGVNPLYAWFHVKGINPDVMLEKTNLEGRMLASWPAGIQKPTGKQLIEWILTPVPSKKRMHATHVGSISMDWKGIYDACMILGITPDMLMPSNGSVHSNEFVTEPAPREVVEAAVHMFEDLSGIGVPRTLLNFLVAECYKADRIGFEQLNPHFPENAKMMELADDAFDSVEEDVAEALMQADGEKDQFASPTTILYDGIHIVCGEYENQMLIGIGNRAKDMEKLTVGRDEHEKIIQRCASAIAPMMKGSDWLHAVNDAIGKEGLEPVLKKIEKDPAAYHAVRPFLDSATTMLPDGSCPKGQRIVEKFCEAYRAFSYCAREASPRKIAQLENEQEAMLTLLIDFQTWFRAPQTDKYFLALANSRYIEQELGGWVPGPAARQTPRKGHPVLRLPKPQPPAGT